MINLEELKKIDLKSIDLKSIDIGKLLSSLMEKKDVFAQVVVVGVSVLILFNIVSSYFKEQSDYRQQIEQLKAKQPVIESYEQNSKKLNAFWASLPKQLEADDLSTKLTDYANQNNINIDSLSPSPVTADLGSSSISSQINIDADTYKDFLFFIKSLRDSTFSLRIDSITLNSNADSTKSGKTSAITAVLRVSSVSLKK